MIRLKETDFGCVGDLLEQVPYNVLMAQAVVTGRAGGAIWVDTVPNPRACYLRHQYGMAYLVGLTEDANFHSALKQYLLNPSGRRVAPEYLQVFPEHWTRLLEPLVKNGAIKRWDRSNFRFEADNAQGDLQGVVLRADRAAAESFRGAVVPEKFWHSLDSFLSHGVAFRHCLPGSRDAGVTTALAFSAYRDEHHLELGIETAPEYRGHGYARLACRALIQYCLEAGLIPVWSCRTQNQASYRLALSLGFKETSRHPYYELPLMLC